MQGVPAVLAGAPSPIGVPVQGTPNGNPVKVDGSTIIVTAVPSTVAMAANQTNIQSAPGTSATTAATVQGSASGVPLPTAAKGASNGVSGQVSCGTTATLVASARTGRAKIIFNSTAATAFYYGFTPGLTTSTGQYVAAVAGASTSLDYAGALYCVVPTGTLTLSYVELF